ncbi:glycosyltransferase [Agromyces sp. SYSU T00266]|uniref:glycosyltransferase n=1 Tax=Agromyces zhanjiangensis TaxID=3158562 RepID=UPI00339996C0
MSTYLLCASPIQGHASPVIEIARDLVARGHDVTVLTGSRFRAAVEAAGASHRSLTGIADFDDRAIQDHLPDRDRHRGIAKLEYDVQRIFVLPMSEQFRALAELVEELAPDAILLEAAFTGAIPLLLDDPATRPPIIAVGVIPLSHRSTDTAPSGLGLPPRSDAVGRLRNRALNALVAKGVFRRTQALADRTVRELGRPGLDEFLFDFTKRCDRFLQLSPAEFEYPRSDLSPNVRFVGTVLPGSPATGELPGWWHELDGDRPVVHVSQGTIDNTDFGRLLRPTLDALAGRDVLVVAATGGRPVAELGDLPANARAAEFLPYDLLLPKTDVFVTNAGFGGTQYALSHGVPIVAAGDTEDKPEVAMRIQWSGTGLTLRTGSPTAAAVGAAVHRLLSEPSFRDRAREMARRIAGYDSASIIASELEQAASHRAASLPAR